MRKQVDLLELFTALEVPRSEWPHLTGDYEHDVRVWNTFRDDCCRKYYRKAAMRYHPDRESGDEEKFKQAGWAWDILQRVEIPKPRPVFSYVIVHDAWSSQTTAADWTYNGAYTSATFC